VNLGCLCAGKVIERRIGQCGRSVLHCPGKSVLLSRNIGQQAKRFEVDLDVGDRSVWKYNTAVRGA